MSAVVLPPKGSFFRRTFAGNAAIVSFFPHYIPALTMRGNEDKTVKIGQTREEQQD